MIFYFFFHFSLELSFNLSLTYQWKLTSFWLHNPLSIPATLVQIAGWALRFLSGGWSGPACAQSDSTIIHTFIHWVIWENVYHSPKIVTPRRVGVDTKWAEVMPWKKESWELFFCTDRLFWCDVLCVEANAMVFRKIAPASFSIRNELLKGSYEIGTARFLIRPRKTSAKRERSACMIELFLIFIFYIYFYTVLFHHRCIAAFTASLRRRII